MASDKRWMTLALTVFLAAVPVSVTLAQEEPPVEADAAGVWSTVKRLYEQAKEAGEQVPDDVATWAKQDFERIGTWEYEVARLGPDPDELRNKLNELGQERWECFSIVRYGAQLQLTCKRPGKSYIGSVKPFELLKLVPAGLGDASP